MFIDLDGTQLTEGGVQLLVLPVSKAGGEGAFWLLLDSGREALCNVKGHDNLQLPPVVVEMGEVVLQNALASCSKCALLL